MLRAWSAVHIPRRHYANGLAGIPTIRVFEALACGIPLVCSPWNDDEENLFRPGEDYLVVEDGDQMTAELRHLRPRWQSALPACRKWTEDHPRTPYLCAPGRGADRNLPGDCS